jgi:hypothetical protein
MPLSISGLLSSRETDIGQKGLPEGRYRSRHDHSPGMEKGMHYSIYRIFQHWNKNNKVNFPYRHQTYNDMSDRFRFRDDNSPAMEKVMDWSIYRKAWYRVFRFLPRYLPMGWYRCGTSVFYSKHVLSCYGYLQFLQLVSYPFSWLFVTIQYWY